MFESASLAHHVDKAACLREATALREALPDAQYDLKEQRRRRGGKVLIADAA